MNAQFTAGQVGELEWAWERARLDAGRLRHRARDPVLEMCSAATEPPRPGPGCVLVTRLQLVDDLAVGGVCNDRVVRGQVGVHGVVVPGVLAAVEGRVQVLVAAPTASLPVPAMKPSGARCR